MFYRNCVLYLWITLGFWTGSPNSSLSGQRSISPALSYFNKNLQALIPNGCNITVNAGPDITICAGIGKQINGMVTGGYNTITWDPTDGLSNPNIANPIANPSMTTTYTLIARGISANLFTNGGFETGGIAPSTSSYIAQTNLNTFAMTTGSYMVMSVPQIAAQFGCNPPIGAFTMAINPTGPGVNFLCQTIPVTANTVYKLKFKCFGIPYLFGAPPVVDCKINGNSIGTLDVASGLCIQSDADFMWNSGASISANICFSNIGGTGTFSIFSIDDIEFRECCEVKDEVKVTVYELVADVAMPDEINCNNIPLTLDGSGSSQGPGINYEWTTSDGKIVSGDKTHSVKVGAPGTYKLRVIGEFGCEKTISVKVDGNTTPPDLTATNTDIDCKNLTAKIEAISKTLNVMYEWSGPNGYSSSKGTNFNIKEPGDYEVTVTDAYGCKSTKKVTVKDNRTEVFLAIKGDTIQCGEDSIKLIASSVSPKPTFVWKNRDSVLSKNPTLVAKDTGWFFVTVFDSLGCFTSDSFKVLSFQSQVPTQIIAGSLNCKTANIQLRLNSDTSGVVNWTGPNGFTSNLKEPFVKDTGWYYLDLVTKDGCKGKDSVFIKGDFVIPDVTVSKEDTINCLKAQVSITGTTSTIGSTLTWIGPNGILGNNNTYSVSDSGIYSLVVEAANGCLNSSMVRIYKILDTPALILMNDTLDCLRKSITLSVRSDPTVKFTWSGPGGFTSNSGSPTVSESGEYQVTATSVNGCQKFGIINIAIDTTPPNISLKIDTITCSRLTITPLLSADPNIISFDWNGPSNYNSKVSNPILSTAGNYSVVVTNSKGCSSAKSFTVFEDRIMPMVSISADNIVCNQQAFIRILNITPNANFQWTGPNNFNSSQSQVQVTIAGWYRIKVTLPNGCETIDSVEVIQKDKLPDLTTKDDSLTCSKLSLNLFADSQTPGVTFEWTGPNNFNSTQKNPTTAIPGIYTVKVKDVNGCEVIKQVVISEFTSKANIVLSNLDSLTCKDNAANISLTADQNASVINWSGPGNFNSNTKNIRVNQGGWYKVRLVNDFGCVSEDSIFINDYRMLPVASVANDSINCGRRNILLSLTTGEPNLSYQWSGPNNFTSSIQNPNVNQGGTYNVTITNSLNCSLVLSLQIKLDTTGPDLSLSADTITCLRPNVPIKAGTSLQGFNIIWSGPNNFTSMFPQAIVKAPGLYTCTLTNPRTKCQTTKFIQVLEDTNRIHKAEIMASDAACGKDNGSINILNILGGSPSYQYSIDNGLNFISQSSFNNLNSGFYRIKIRDKNGCEYSDSIIINQSSGVSINLIPSLTLNLNEQRVLDLVINNASNFTIFWNPSDQLSCSSCEDPIITAVKDQRIMVIVIDENGCSDTSFLDIRVLADDHVYVPNVFSPNGDGVNEYFGPVFSSKDVLVSKFSIFSRWGELIFDKENFIFQSEKDGWNGEFQGRRVNPGVYIYRITYNSGTESKTIYGDITVLR